ncbi:hypothetical protein BG015_001301, partial [Linnemannia schmuckeri]
TKTKIQIETSELEREIQQLEKTIAEQERKLAAKRAYDESIRETKQRSEAAQSVYKSLTSPIAATTGSSSRAAGAPKQIGNNPNAQSYLPETFLQDLKLTFLDTRTDRSETVRQLQSGLPTSEDLRSAAAATLGSQQQQGKSRDVAKVSQAGAEAGIASEMRLAEITEKDSNQLAFERVRNLGVDKWNQLIYVNALEGNSENAEQVMRLMEEVGVQPDLDSFTHLMEAYYNAGELKKAQGTIEMMLNNGIVPSMAAFNSLMKIHVRRRDITGAFQVFEALKKHHNPDVEVFTNLVKGCLRADEYDLGWKVFDQMQRSGATPVENTYSLMIRACAKTDQVERALDIFRTYPTRKLQPTDATFNSLIHACAMRPEYFTTAFALLNEMQTVYGFEPDILTYNTLLFACSKRQDLLTARRVFQKVVQLDSEGTLKLDGVTVTNFLWCVTEWKDTDVHLKSFKMRHRNSATGQIEPPESIIPVSAAERAITDISLRPSYFLLPERPPANEHEALLEGESVFSWFVSRAATEAESDNTTSEQDQQQDTESSAVTATTMATTISTLPLPHLSPQSPIRTRLLNAYLAMYVRHNSVEKSTEIYRQYFDHFGRTRDSWTYSTMLEGCYHWKDVDLGAEVFRDWRDWRMSTGKLTEKRTRYADYQCYRRMINLLARTNHLDESIALLEELAIAATPTNTRLRSEIASAAAPASSVSSPTTTTASSSSSSFSSSASTPASTSASSQALTTTTSPSLLFLSKIQDESVLPIYPQLKDFPIVYTKTWELEDESARRLLLRLCHSSPSSSKRSKSSPSSVESDDNVDEDDGKASIFPMHLDDKRRARYQKSLRNTAIKWKGEHSHGRQEKGFMVGERRLRELEQDSSKRGQDHRRSFKGPRF